MHYICNIVFQEVGIEDWVGFSDTEGANEFLSTFIYKNNTSEGVPTDDDFMYYYNTKKDEVTLATLKKKTHLIRRLGFVIDDCNTESDILRRSKVLTKYVSNQRHLRTFFFICVQNIMQLPPKLRDQIDVLFILRADGPEAIMKVYSMYLTGRLGVQTMKYRKNEELYRLQTYIQWYNKPGSCLVVTKNGGINARYLSHMSWSSDYDLEGGKLGDEISRKIAEAYDEEKNEEESIRQIEQRMKRDRESRFQDKY